MREAASDRHGVIELEPMVWRTEIGAEAELLLLRDLGPSENASLSALTGREWLVYVAGEAGAGPSLLPYDVGMELLWRGAASADLR